MRDLDDKENVALRKELAPLLEPLEPKDVRDKWKLLFNGKKLHYLIFRSPATILRI